MSDAIRADKVKAESIRFLWPTESNLRSDHDDYKPGRIPEGMLTVLAGQPGQGKSMATAYFAQYVSNLPAPQRNGVLFSNMEDPLAQVLKPRIEASGANLKNIHFYNFHLPKEPVALEAAIESLKTMIGALNIGLIIADPIAAHLGVSLYNDQEVRRALSPLTKMLAETNTAMIAVAHVNKHVSKNSSALGAIGGSGGGLVGAARAVYVFGTDPQDENVRVMAPVKFNIGAHHPGVAFDMESEEWVIGKGEKATVITTGRLNFLSDEHPASAIDILVGKKGEGEGVPAEKKAIAAEWLASYLGAGPQAATVVREDAADQGISWATLRRAADEVGVLKQRQGFGPGSHITWDLPDGHPDKVPANVIPTAADLAADLNTEITDEDIANLLGGDVDTTEGG